MSRLLEPRADVKGAVLEAAEGAPNVAMQGSRERASAGRPAIESLARIDELARVWEMMKVTQADRLEWRERATYRWPASETAD